METIIWGAILRFASAAVQACPTLLIGWLTAAILERVLGREGTFKLFGGSTWRSLPQAWFLGMLLPVCSLGALPIMYQMRKSGISGGTILAFGLTAPLFNPISVLFGLTLATPTTIIVFCLCSFAIVTLAGTIWDRLFESPAQTAAQLPPSPFGWRRVLIVFLSTARQSLDAPTKYAFLGLAGAAILSMFLPPGILQRAANYDDPFAPLTMSGVATFAYVTPMVAINNIASMFEHGNSVGAAFTLLILGTGVNLGMLAWVGVHYGMRRLLGWSLLLTGIVLTFGYALNKPLYPKGVEAADHTHAFDAFCQPFLPGTENLPHLVWQKLNDQARPEELVALALITAAFPIGWIALRAGWIEELMASRPSSVQTAGKYDMVLPPSMIAISCFAGLIAMSVGACYMYYPSRDEILKEMVITNGDLFSAANAFEWDGVERYLPIQEEWIHRLIVSSYLRNQPLSRFQKAKLQVLQMRLELLEHATEVQDREKTQAVVRQMAMSFHRLRQSLRE